MPGRQCLLGGAEPRTATGASETISAATHDRTRCTLTPPGRGDGPWCGRRRTERVALRQAMSLRPKLRPQEVCRPAVSVGLEPGHEDFVRRMIAAIGASAADPAEAAAWTWRQAASQTHRETVTWSRRQPAARAGVKATARPGVEATTGRGAQAAAGGAAQAPAGARRGPAAGAGPEPAASSGEPSAARSGRQVARPHREDFLRPWADLRYLGSVVTPMRCASTARAH